MALNVDPSRTARIRAGFSTEMKRRMKALKKIVVEAIATDDALGLEKGGNPLHNALPRQVWRFRTDVDKLEAFKAWFAGQVAEKVISTDGPRAEPWVAKYVASAYKQGRIRAYIDSKKIKPPRGLPKPADFLTGARAEYLRQAFSQPEQIGKVKLLYTRSFELLKGVTSQMATDMNRILADGITQGQNPKVIARTMANDIDGLTRKRALVIARTEVIHAHSEGQLDSFEDLGVKEVGVYAEWHTASDPCPLCAPLNGTIMTVKEARGKIPRHPNCRCSWIPALDVNTKNRRRSLLRKVNKSLAEEGGARKSRWAGKLLPRRKK